MKIEGMMINMEVMEWLGIPEDLRESAMLSLTHRSVRNTDSDIDGDKLKYYSELGKNVYEALLIKFVYHNFSLGLNGVFEVMKASKSPCLMYSRLRLNELSVISKGVKLDSVIDDLVYQFLGFLYAEMGFDFTYGVFTKAFSKKDVVYFSDYLSVINIVAGGKGLQFTELESGGPAHAPYFKYKLTIHGKEVCASGSSKKAAKKMCAQKFCEENLTAKEIFRILGYGETVYRKRTPYSFSVKDQATIAKISRKWGFAEKDIRNAAVNKILYNEYEFEDCSCAIMIGGFYERMIIRKIVYKLFSQYSFSVQMDIVSEFDNNDMIFKGIVEKLEISDLFVLKEKLSTQLSAEARNKEAVRQLIFHAIENNNTQFLKLIEKAVLRLSKNLNPHLLNPSSKVSAMYGKMKEQEPKVSITQGKAQSHFHKNQDYYFAKIPVSFGNATVTYQGESTKKVAAINNAYSKFWQYLYNSMNNVFKTKNPTEYAWFFTIIADHFDWFVAYLIENAHFVYDSYKKDDFEQFVQYIHVFYYNAQSFDGGRLIPIINAFMENKVAAIKVDQKDILLSAIWEYNVSHKPETAITVLRNIDEIVRLSDEQWKKMLKRNGRLIRHLSLPDEEMQLIAVQQCPQAINYIAAPSPSIVDYAYHHSPEQSIELRPAVIEGLLDAKRQEIAHYTGSATKSDQTVFLLEPHCFDLYLRAILGSYKVREFYIACGFVYASGIKMLRSEIGTLLADGMCVKILAGNLQHYFSGHPVSQMDLETAQELNRLIKAGVELKTITDNFYHGKMYCLVCDEATFVIVGSTNMSKNAFRHNSEIDNLLVYRTSKNPHTNYFDALWRKAISIHELDENRFSPPVASGEIESRHVLDIDAVRDRIQQIEDIDLRMRLVTWLKYSPTNIYDEIDVAGKEYIAIEFSDKKMVVLESFYPGNSYFVFNNHSVDTLLGAISGRTKTEVFELSGMEKRGYHIREQLKLEVKIASYFV